MIDQNLDMLAPQIDYDSDSSAMFPHTNFELPNNIVGNFINTLRCGIPTTSVFSVVVDFLYHSLMDKIILRMSWTRQFLYFVVKDGEYGFEVIIRIRNHHDGFEIKTTIRNPFIKRFMRLEHKELFLPQKYSYKTLFQLNTIGDVYRHQLSKVDNTSVTVRRWVKYVSHIFEQIFYHPWEDKYQIPTQILDRRIVTPQHTYHFIDGGVLETTNEPFIFVDSSGDIPMVESKSRRNLSYSEFIDRGLVSLKQLPCGILFPFVYRNHV